MADGTAAPSNKGMKLTKLSAAPLRGRSAASCPRRSTSNAGTASQLIPGVLRTMRSERWQGKTMTERSAADGNVSGLTHKRSGVGWAVLVVLVVFSAHAVLQWLAWAGHPGHTVNGVTLPWWPPVWAIVSAPACWLTDLDLASHWELITANGAFWALLAGVAMRLRQRQVSRLTRRA